MNMDVKRVGRELIHKGVCIDYYVDHMEFSNGNKEDWDFIHHDGATAVVPVLEDGRILMVRQYRNALERETLEIPAGKLDAPDEPPIECAKRECEEETGYKAGQIEWLITVQTTIAFCDERVTVFLARDLKPTKQRLDENEFVNVEIYSIDELKEKIFRGEIQDGKTISALLAYDAKFARTS